MSGDPIPPRHLTRLRPSSLIWARSGSPRPLRAISPRSIICIVRSICPRPDQAKALRWTTLSEALDRMGDDLIDLRDAALLCLAYDTFAQASELISSNVGDIHQDIDGATVFIRASKTDQEGQRDDRFMATSTYARIAAWVQAARLQRDDPFFIPLGFAAKNDRLSTGDISAIIARRCGDRYSAHSTRVGQHKTPCQQVRRQARSSRRADGKANGWCCATGAGSGRRKALRPCLPRCRGGDQ